MSSPERKRRSRPEIIYEILKICQKPIVKTQIMYKANLSFAQLNKYLGFLKERELIKTVKIKGKELFQITRRGREYIKSFEKIQKLIK